MIAYVVSENPDNRVLDRASSSMKEGGIICFPTDTNWVLAACPFSKAGVEKLYKTKRVDRKKHLSIVCNTISQASKYAIISNLIYRSIKSNIPGPYTFIFNPTRDLPKVIKNYRGDRQIGIRIPDSTLCRRLVHAHNSPLITTTLSPSLDEQFSDYDVEQSGGLLSYQIEEVLGHQLDMILDPCDFEINGPSSVIDFSSDYTPVVVREGVGDISSYE